MEYIDGQYVYGDDVYVDDYYMDEKWTYISGFPDYMISDKARVYSIKNKQFLKLKQLDSHGHLGVCLYENGKRYYRYIHRLVAEAFIPNPENLPIVRHIIDDPEQNTVDDIAWGTQKDNMHDAMKNGSFYFISDEDRYAGNADRMMPIIATNISSGEKMHFRSQGEASRILMIPQANIWKVLHGQRKAAGGYLFEEGQPNGIY